jgi:hypothetical protein
MSGTATPTKNGSMKPSGSSQEDIYNVGVKHSEPAVV